MHCTHPWPRSLARSGAWLWCSFRRPPQPFPYCSPGQAFPPSLESDQLWPSSRGCLGFPATPGACSLPLSPLYRTALSWVQSSSPVLFSVLFPLSMLMQSVLRSISFLPGLLQWTLHWLPVILKASLSPGLKCFWPHRALMMRSEFCHRSAGLLRPS